MMGSYKSLIYTGRRVCLEVLGASHSSIEVPGSSQIAVERGERKAYGGVSL
jgi:hypothetical protein